jgi:hypothetical protein
LEKLNNPKLNNSSGLLTSHANLYTQAVTAQKREAIGKIAELVLPKKQAARQGSGSKTIVSAP